MEENGFEQAVRRLVLAVATLESCFVTRHIRVTVESGGVRWNGRLAYFEIVVGESWERWNSVISTEPWLAATILEVGQDLLELCIVEQALYQEKIEAVVVASAPWLTAMRDDV